MSKVLWNDQWFFTKQSIGTTIQEARAAQWTAVDIPHDWLIANTNALYEDGEGWYKKSLTLANGPQDENIALRFEGVYMNCSVFVNGSLAGDWKYGYSTFEFAIHPYLHEGQNEILVRVVHQAPNSRWYSGAGIYRNVWLKRRNRQHLVSDGIYITPEKNDTGWTVTVTAEIAHATDNLRLRHSILASDGSCVTTTEAAANQPAFLQCQKPLLWDTTTPHCYTLKTELFLNDTLLETEENIFGFRTIEFCPEKGFFLNGRLTKIHGVCQHHDLGLLGAAVNKAALRRQFTLLREMGVNGIRTSHNMPAVQFMELADEMGFLICSEAFDMWRRPKTTYDYARFFDDWVQKDVASWVRRDRNHPSVIMWSIGNEIYDTHADESAQDVTRMLKDLVQQHDPNAHAPVTIGSNYMPWENAQKCADIVKLAGYNYAERHYEEHHHEHPDWIIYGSETASTVQSRGVYHFPLDRSMLANDDEQCSSLGNCTTSWGARSTERCIIDDRDAAFTPGMFIWTGFDYIGEPTPYHTKNSYFGQIDTAGFKKDAFYIYQAEWTSYKENPMVHIFPYWDFSENQIINVRCCSNAPVVELFFNGQSLGKFEIDHKNGKKLIGDWQLPYQKGTLKAVAYDENNTPIAEDVRHSFTDVQSLVLTPDKVSLQTSDDLIFIAITANDSDNHPVENANNRVQVTVTGAGRLMGLDNGDSTDYEPYQTTSRRLFNGKLLAVVGATAKSGAITVTVTSPGLPAAILTLQAENIEMLTGVSQTFTTVPPAPDNNEIPIRKVEIISPTGCQFTPENPTKTITAKIFPPNATYTNLEWKVTDSAGIEIGIAKIAQVNDTIQLTSVSDGTFDLRCIVRNGGEKVSFYTQLTFTVSGMGEATLNPYQFVTGGLYNASNNELTNGNERGVASAREGESHIGFKGLDFGEQGATEITLPIFTLNDEPYPIEIWEGMPNDPGSDHICTVIYQKPSIWNTYQEETYVLPRPLKGITTLCLVLRHKLHIKGFVFKQPDTPSATDPISALQYKSLYGDSFTLTEDAITKIGNNVSITYQQPAWEQLQFNSITILGKTPLDKTAIQIKISSPATAPEQIVMIDFPHAAAFSPQAFTLPETNGCRQITFLFLPGSQFDFKSFQLCKI